MVKRIKFKRLDNPLVTLGVNQALIKRYLQLTESQGKKSEDSPVYVLDVKRFAEVVGKIGITQMGHFHPDRNLGDPVAEAIFKTVAAAHEQVQRDPESTQAYASEFLESPADVVTQVREEANIAIKQHEENEAALKEQIIEFFIRHALGDSFWTSSIPNNRRFLMRRFELDRMLGEGRIGVDLLVNRPADIMRAGNLRELHVTANGTLRMFKVAEGNDVLEQQIERHRPKKEQLIIQEKFVMSSSKSDKKEQGFYRVYNRASAEPDDLSEVRVIGSINPEKYRNALPKLQALYTAFDETFKTNTYDDITGASGLNNQLKLLGYSGEIDKVTPVKNAYETVYKNGVSVKHFSELADFIEPTIDEGLIFACKKTEEGIRIFLLGENIPLHQKTPGLTVKSK